MTYQEKLDWLFSRFPSYQNVGGVAYKAGIETMKSFDRALGHPHTKFRTIHIAGTNGKGSTSHMLAAGLASCGYKVGLYTSPHLKDFRERIRIVANGSYEMIPQQSVEAFLDLWKPFFEKENPSFFEITTAMAFDYFAQRQVDIAVIETGLGGRLDSTNIITPILSVITNIGLEHCEHLGDTLEKIAFEKAGIIKPLIPVAIGEYTMETKPVFQSVASSCSAQIIFAGDVDSVFSISSSDLDLKGDYQERNLRTLSAAYRLLSGIISVDKKTFEQGVCRTSHITGLRGRWETLREAGAGKAGIICDTGHNAHGLRWVSEQIDRISCDYGQVWFILGVVKEKDLAAISTCLPRNVNYIFTNASSDRSLPAAELANSLSDQGLNGRVIVPVKQALEYADLHSGEKDLIFISGSNFVVAEVI